MKFITPLFSVLVFALFGCSSVPLVDHSFNPNYDLARYRTFAVLPLPHSPSDTLAHAVLGEEDISLVAIRAVLEAKGFVYQEEILPDFVVGVRAEVGMEQPKGVANIFADKILFNTWFDTVGYSQQPPTGESITSNRESDLRKSADYINRKETLVSMSVEIFDTSSKEIVWKGWASTSSLEAFHNDSNRLKIVNQILQRFPN